MLLGLVLSGCSAIDELVFGPDPGPDAQPVATALEPDAPYPRVATVPPRPQLSYSVEQERQIVDALINDRENARYTGQAIRYRSGLTDAPPEAPEGLDPAREADAIVAQAPSGGEIGSEAEAASEAEYADEAEATGNTASPVSVAPEVVVVDDQEALPEETAESDDGGLVDFVRGMVQETETEPSLGSEAAVRRQPAESESIPGQKSKESAFQRLFAWIGEQFGGQGDDEAGRTTAPPAGSSAGPASTEADRDTDAAVPEIMPEASANAPAPAPAKPEGALEQTEGPDRTIETPA
jgi:hypothetical protein